MTTTVDFTVRGRHEVAVPAERATIHIIIRHIGPEKREIFEATAADTEQLTTELRYLHHPETGPVTDWTASDLELGAHARWTKDGERLDDEHYARIRIAAEFSDFEELNRFTGAVAALDGGAIDHTHWSITDASRDAAEQEVRAGAARDARDRAQVYADALGLGSVRAVSVAEPGLLQAASPRSPLGAPHGAPDGDAAAFAPDPDSSVTGAPPPRPSIAQTPEDITVAASVEARFVADPSD
ncbi:SIMPL domain-containing protein [Tsukamurella asaccharolytica]|uniref:SIMPL domain-containing protein n=1 Tax=Tsukamurella asaccharolytica TaxID=2592067 RepID=A0A5C5R7A3_9ACTN|nr:SIMPL domain-containing protein [Tsukamurella asaccharolytica]TWS18708.1 SIMPL domain-containing protein [Tsukamurella asaccharolytica]